jgi:WD40 repeat protein
VRPERLLLAVLLLVVRVPGIPAQELTERGTFKGHKYWVERAELSPDGKVLAAGGGDTRGGELKLWSAVTGKEIVSLPGYTNSLYSLAFSADGKRLASGGYGPVQVWDVNAHTEIASLKELTLFTSVIALNRDGTRVAAVERGQAKLWEVVPGKELASFRYHVPGGGGRAFSRDLATLAAGNYQEIDLWDTATGKAKATLSEHRGEVGCMIWSADDKTLIASSTRYEGKGFKWKGDLKLWDVASGKERATLPGSFGRVLAMAPSPDNKTLALLDSADRDAECDLKLVDIDTGRQRVLRALPGWSFRSLRFTTEDKLLVLGASVDTVRLWEVSLPKRDTKP